MFDTLNAVKATTVEFEQIRALIRSRSGFPAYLTDYVQVCREFAEQSLLTQAAALDLIDRLETAPCIDGRDHRPFYERSEPEVGFVGGTVCYVCDANLD